MAGSTGRPTNKELRQDAVDLRREKVLELTSQGYSQRQIANMLHISHGTVGLDQTFLTQKATENIREYIDKLLPEEYEKCLVGITSILREAWNTSKQENIDNREKIAALTLAKDCYSMKLDLLTNANVIDDAARFVTAHTKKESEEGQEQQKQPEEEAVEGETTNQVF